MSDMGDFVMRRGQTTYAGPVATRKWYQRLISKAASVAKDAYKAVRKTRNNPPQGNRQEGSAKPRVYRTGYFVDRSCRRDGGDSSSSKTGGRPSTTQRAGQRSEETLQRATPIPTEIPILAPTPLSRSKISRILEQDLRPSPTPTPIPTLSPCSPLSSSLTEGWAPSLGSSTSSLTVPPTARLSEPFSDMPAGGEFYDDLSPEREERIGSYRGLVYLNPSRSELQLSYEPIPSEIGVAVPFDERNGGTVLSHRDLPHHSPKPAIPSRPALRGHAPPNCPPTPAIPPLSALRGQVRAGPPQPPLFHPFSTFSSVGVVLTRTPPPSEERLQRSRPLRRQGAVRVKR
ncbi:hypothetical protein MMC30_001295 [Trapelia coarctata]|nr:hypothetical protein [Trapelia coarctata]